MQYLVPVLFEIQPSQGIVLENRLPIPKEMELRASYRPRVIESTSSVSWVSADIELL